MYKMGFIHTDNFTVTVGIIDSNGPIDVLEMNVCVIHNNAYGDQHIKYEKFIIRRSWNFLLCFLKFSSRASLNVKMRASTQVSIDAMIVMVVGMTNPKISIYKMYVLLLFAECQSGAQPTPESSGTYLPHPHNGGSVSANEYNQIKDNIFDDVLYECTFSAIFPYRKILP